MNAISHKYLTVTLVLIAMLITYTGTLLTVSVMIHGPKPAITSAIVPISGQTPAGQIPGINNGSLSIHRVYTTDAARNRQSTFQRGDTLGLAVDINNTMRKEASIELHYTVSVTDHNRFVRSHFYNYSSTLGIEDVPQGLSTEYLPVSIPSDAAPATYALQVTAMSIDRDFLASSNTAAFTIQPPTRLGLFKTRNFSRNGGSTQGSSQLTIYYNGEYNFQGCFQNSSLLPVSDAVTWVITSASGVAYQFVHTGSAAGIVGFGASNRDCWNVTGVNSAIAEDWIPLSIKANAQWNADANTDLGPVLNGIWKFITVVAGPIVSKIINVIWDKVSMALEDGAGGAVADGAEGLAAL